MSTSNRLAFSCSVCGNAEEPETKIKPGFEFIAYDTMIEWSDFTDEPPQQSDHYWLRSVVTPMQDETRCVQAAYPFNFTIGEQFWALYMPADSYFNGWYEHPEEIEQSAVVQCAFEDILSRDESSAWIRIRVIDVITLREICDKFPVVKCDTYLAELRKLRYVGSTTYYEKDSGSFIEYDWNGQSDVGYWALVHRHHSGSNRMILYCEWSYHHSVVYCGNIEVDKTLVP